MTLQAKINANHPISQATSTRLLAGDYPFQFNAGQGNDSFWNYGQGPGWADIIILEASARLREHLTSGKGCTKKESPDCYSFEMNYKYELTKSMHLDGWTHWHVAVPLRSKEQAAEQGISYRRFRYACKFWVSPDGGICLGKLCMEGKEVPSIFPAIGHDDHPISAEQYEWVQTHPLLMKSLVEKPGSFIITVLELPEHLGTIPCALYGPEAGDDPVDEVQVEYFIRNGRANSSRMINLPNRPATRVAVIGVAGAVAITLYGTQAERISPMEPWDPKLNTPELKKESEEFWSKHALSTEGHK